METRGFEPLFEPVINFKSAKNNLENRFLDETPLLDNLLNLRIIQLLFMTRSSTVEQNRGKGNETRKDVLIQKLRDIFAIVGYC